MSFEVTLSAWIDGERTKNGSNEPFVGKELVRPYDRVFLFGELR